MWFFPIIIFAVAANLDNLVIGFSYGMKRIVIPWGSNLLISAITFLSTLLSVIAGKALPVLLPAFATQAVGGVILILLGIWGAAGAVLKQHSHAKKQKESPGSPCQDSPQTHARTIGWREALALGGALSINNLGMGIGMGMGRIHALGVAIAALYIGNLAGRKIFSQKLGLWTELLAGTLVIGLGIWEWLG